MGLRMSHVRRVFHRNLADGPGLEKHRHSRLPHALKMRFLIAQRCSHQVKAEKEGHPRAKMQRPVRHRPHLGICGTEGGRRELLLAGVLRLLLCALIRSLVRVFSKRPWPPIVRSSVEGTHSHHKITTSTIELRVMLTKLEPPRCGHVMTNMLGHTTLFDDIHCHNMPEPVRLRARFAPAPSAALWVRRIASWRLSVRQVNLQVVVTLRTEMFPVGRPRT
mmetsp:Transcript_32099/g.85954  ORF Transcript_32099/g.85954 Transcript_32099/m.85954 type:complete len:220 (+) Transcript_32099:342-1001(+)